MPRVIRVLGVGANGGRASSDSVLLTPDQRRVQRGELIGVAGTPCLLALPEAVGLRGGDVLELNDGSTVDIVAEPEPLIEVRASDLVQLAKIAWHLGDRHL